MSITIAIGYRKRDEACIKAALLEAAQPFGYQIVSGIDHAEDDVKGGLAHFLEKGLARSSVDKFQDVFLLKTVDSSDAALAYGIYHEFKVNQPQDLKPPFLNFLEGLKSLLEKDNSCVGLMFVFCSEFSATDEVRFMSGTLNDLVSFLALPGAWTLQLWSPESGIIQESDRYPVVFYAS